MTKFVLNWTGKFLNMTWIVLNMTGFVLIKTGFDDDNDGESNGMAYWKFWIVSCSSWDLPVN